MPQPENGDCIKTTPIDQQSDGIWFARTAAPSTNGLGDRGDLEAILVNIAEEQQRKIGRDLHDDLCSQLSGIGCLTKMLEGQLRDDQQQQTALLRRITEMVASAGQTARDIARELVPSVLEVHGLVGALKELTERQQRRFGMNCDLSVGDTRFIEGLEERISVQIYRIAQEAISNAIRHSDADRVLISLFANERSIDFSVSDDGKGMAEELVSIGMGLITMKRRAELINASFSVRASLGAGATVHCSIPLVM